MTHSRPLFPIQIMRWCVTASLCALSGACAGQLNSLGRPPDISVIGDPAQQTEARIVSMPMPAPTETIRTRGAIWTAGRTSFFQDQRARRVGDLLTVLIDIDDEATLRNSTSRTRDGREELDVGDLFGLQSGLSTALSESFDPDTAVDIGSSSSSDGAGTIDRNESISLRVAAVVTQQLPNGNLVIAGRQEVRVNFELRELRIAGVIRREDIAQNNTIQYDQVAEARIAYGGRGQITNVTQPRIGQQVYDIIMPF